MHKEQDGGVLMQNHFVKSKSMWLALTQGMHPT
jgi:hypothetical protein